ncbi:MAG: Tetratricopeptide repeat protein [Methanosaeta sp. PtaB.Bin039]|nr:MAG: Tetratricopeptide repeat protein [Methanosaeta sp. PtaB.Bin039]
MLSFRDLKDTSTEAWFLNDLGWMFYDKGEVGRAIEQYNQTLQFNIANESFKSYYKAYPLFCLGLAYYKLDSRAYAVKIGDCFATSKGLRESKKYRFPDDDLLIAKIDMNIARLHLNEGRTKESLSHLKSSLEYYAKYKDYIENLTPRRRAMELENIANAHFIYGKYYLDDDSIQGAEHEFGLALSASDSIATKAKFYNNMAYIHHKRGENEKAADKFVLAAETDRSLKDRTG